MTAVLKFRFSGEVRRSQIQLADLDADAVVRELSRLWPALGDRSLGYFDEDGDLCGLCPATFADFLEHGTESGGKTVFRVEVGEAQGQPEPPAAGAQAAGAPPAAGAPGAAAAGEAAGAPQASAAAGPWAAAAQAAQAFAAAAGPWAARAACADRPGGAWPPCHADPAAVLQQLAGHWVQHWKQHEQQWKQHWKQHEQHWKQHEQHWKHHAQQWKQWHGRGHAPPCGAEGSDGSQGRAADEDSWLVRPEKLLWVAVQLENAAMLSPGVLAGMAASMLPKIAAHAAGDVASFGRVFLKQPATCEPPFWKALIQLAQDKPGLLVRLPPIDTCDEVEVGQCILAVLLGLSGLPFEEQIVFLEAFFASQIERIRAFVREWHGGAMWPFVMVHHGITCDGCEMSPVKGPRFKCQSCDDIDLCGHCFQKKCSVLDGFHADHDFRLIVWPEDSFRGWQGMKGAGKVGKMAFKGMCGKGGGKGCGKGKCKGGFKGMGTPGPRACAGGCGLQATWHPTHCCVACVLGSGKHGRYCEQKPFPTDAEATANVVPSPAQVTSAPAPEALAPADWAQAKVAPFDAAPADAAQALQAAPLEPEAPPVSAVAGQTAPSEPAAPEQPEPSREPSPAPLAVCPVVLGDGAQVQMRWFVGEDPLEVAARFVHEHGLPMDEIHDIAAVVSAFH